MATNSKIEWTEQTWNPTTGCTKVSPGCAHCYAEVMARRLEAMGVNGYENGFELTLMPERLDEPLRRKRPTTYFVNSMSDLFHEDIPDSYIQDIFQVIEKASQHTFQILTKRAERMAEFMSGRVAPKNAWMGVTVENREHGLPRIESLRQVDARIRFLSMEPLLEDVGEFDLSGIHWVIVGGESGPKARPMRPEWASNIKRQCDDQQGAFFFSNGEDGGRMVRNGQKRKMGEFLRDGLGMGCQRQ